MSNEHPNLGNLGTYEYRYDYDWSTSQYTMLGQRDRIIVSAHASAQQNAGTTKYRYDASYQLIEVDDPDGGWTKWQYDAIGNRITHQRHYDSTPTPYEYWKYAGNSNNSSRLKTVSSQSYTYDANGNSLRNGAVWDPLNRLTSMTGSTFTYDWSNRRVKHSSKAFDYVGLNIARERDTTYQTLNDYLFGPGIDEPLVRMDKTGAKYYYAVDGLGSVMVELNAAGDVENAQKFDAWGSGAMNAAFGYTGREPAGGGWLYYRARYYEPGVGMFAGEDPAGLFVSPNPYAYVSANPVRYTDPLGLTGNDSLPYQPGKPYCDFGACVPPAKQPAPSFKPPTPGCFKSLPKLISLKENLNKSPATDKWKHCVFGCALANKCGKPSGWAASYGKELVDVFGPGDAEWADTTATNAGVTCKGSSLGCDCCCRNAGFDP
jgi:RHS repeat-associated protein